MATEAELEKALDQSITQTKALGEIEQNKPKYDQKADQLEAVVNPNNSYGELKTPYDSKYPYNHSLTSESGHSIEMDDTPGAERVAITHRSGTFSEIHPDGSKVEKILNDNVQIIVKDNQVYIMGNEQKTTQGSLKLYIKGNAKLQVDGSVELEVKGDFAMKVDGTFSAMADSFNFIGPINQVGDFSSTGNIINQGNISSDKNIQAQLDIVGHRNVIVDGYGDYGGDVTAGSISLQNHTHPIVGGGNTEPPQ
jgi:hypothetical protein